jgi:hypothetical protein
MSARITLYSTGLCLAFLLPVRAQFQVRPGTPAFQQISKFFNEEYGKAANQPLACKVEPIRPRMAFSFRFFTGFVATVPARQFTGNQNGLVMLMRVTAAQAAEPSYFAYSVDLPPIPENPGKTEFEFSGGVYTGEGQYKIDLALTDRNDRLCGKAWTVRASERKIPLQQPANTVTAIGLDEWKGMPKQDTQSRVTVFVHAIPLYYRRYVTKLNAFDRLTLLGSLTSLLDQSKFTSARVVVFDLMGKRVLFKQDNFDPAGYKRLVNKLDTVSYGTIDYRVLRDGPTDRTMIERLMREELKEPNPSDAIVFLGAEGRPAPKLTSEDVPFVGDLPAMFYMGFVRFPVPMEDAMYRLVKSAKGKTVMVMRPVDLANGIKSLMQSAAAGSTGQN